MTNDVLEKLTSAYFRMKFNEFKSAVMLETSFSDEKRQKLYALLDQIEQEIQNAG